MEIGVLRLVEPCISDRSRCSFPAPSTGVWSVHCTLEQTGCQRLGCDELTRNTYGLGSGNDIADGRLVQTTVEQRPPLVERKIEIL